MRNKQQWYRDAEQEIEQGHGVLLFEAVSNITYQNPATEAGRQ